MFFFWDETVGVHDAPPQVNADGTIVKQKKLRRSKSVQIPQNIVFIGVVLLMTLNCLNRGILGIYETVSVKMYLKANHEHESSPTAVANASQFQLGLGLVGVITYLALDPLAQRGFSEAKLIVIGFLAEAIGTIFSIYENFFNLFLYKNIAKIR